MGSELVIYDISPVIHPGLAVWPGDQAFQRRIAMDFAKGDHLTLSSMEATFHLGAHADAPSHYSAEGVGIADRSLRPYFGMAQVIEVKTKKGQRILPSDFSKKIEAPRVLFRTNSFPDPDVWNNDFSSLSPELSELLAEKEVQLVGIDTPSIDPFDSKALESHKSILKHNICVLEGLVLDQVPEGIYWLSALPLKIKDADASPVRAVLFSLDELTSS